MAQENSTPLVSVLVPVYNVQSYVAKCIKSILRQTYRNLEIILVEDKSTDNSLAICQKLAAKDSRIKLIAKPQNQGVYMARITGIENATGKFLVFVDSDDWMETNAIQIFVNEQQRTGADVVEGFFTRVIDGLGCIKRPIDNAEQRYITQPELFNKYYYSFFGHNILSVSLCNKLYKRELFAADVLQPENLRMGEDLIVNLRIFPKLSSWARVAAYTYNYRYGGITSRYNPTLYDNQKYLYGIKLEEISKHNYDIAINSVHNEMANVLYSTLVQIIRFNYNGGRSYAVQFLQQEVNSGFVNELVNTSSTYNPPHIAAMRKGDCGQLLDLAEAKANEGKLKRIIISIITPILKFI